MGKIEENRKKLQQGLEMGTLTPVEPTEYKAPSGLPGPGDTKNPASTPFLRAPIASNFQLGTDTFRAFQKNTLPGVRMAPLPASFDKNIGAAAKSQIIVNQNTGNAVIVEVNGNKTQNQNLMNFRNGTGMSIVSDAFGGLIFTASATGDGLTHSSAPWESDPAYIVLRDEFQASLAGSGNGVQLASIGQLGWSMIANNPNHDGYQGGLPPNLGAFFWDNTATTLSGSALFLLMTGVDAGSNGSNNGWALLDSPGWQTSWVFRLGGVSPGLSSTPFPFGQKAMYIGLSGVNSVSGWVSGTQGNARPEVFFGCRFDTSGYYNPSPTYSVTAVTQSGNNMALTGTFTGANQTTGTSWVGLWFSVTGSSNGGNNGVFQCTAATTTTLTLTNPLGVTVGAQTITVQGATPLVLTAAANGNGTQVVYTGTITNGGTNLYKGQQFFVSGFGNAGNNGGPWLCTANTTTTITLANPVVTGSAETHAGYAGGPIINDTQFVLEGVANPSYGSGSPANFTQGSTSATGVSPVTGSAAWHRVDIFCNVAGQITMTFDGAHTLTVPVSKQTITITGSALSGSVGSVNQPSEFLSLTWTPTGGTVASSPWASGSQVTVTGFSGAQAGFNGTFTTYDNGNLNGGNLHLLYTPASPNPITVASASVNGTLSGYPSLFPCAFFGNDNAHLPTGSTATCWIDFFSFIWNPNLGPNAPGTPVATKPRYF